MLPANSTWARLMLDQPVYKYCAPDNLLANRVILVTGSSEGIGRAAAKTFARHGASVILHGRNVERLESAYDEIVASGASKPAIVVQDLKTATLEDFMVLKENLVSEFGRLDGLLHNAGILGRRSPVIDISPQDWLDVMQVNINAPFLLTKALLPLLQESADASIVLTSSGVGRKGRAYWGSYAVSKFATEGFMQVLADELDTVSHIRVNTLNPGATNTAMRRAAYPGEMPTRNPAPELIMPAYLYLMGPDSKGITGQAFDAQPQK